MKRIKMAFMALAAASSVGGAFASSPAAQNDPQTYYALRTGDNQFRWTTNNPNDTNPSVECNPTASAAICSIVTSNVPTDNVVPAGHSADGTVFK